MIRPSSPRLPYAPVRSARTVLATVALALAAPAAAAAQAPELCVQAERFLVETMAMIAISEPDTIDDWRTQAMVPGCRVTAAGASRQSSAQVVRAFYQVLDESDWVRTPDPRDAPNEASMRYRRDSADCLFNFYDQAMALNTQAEMDVSDAVHVGPGEKLYNFLVLCTPTAPAAPRG
jgi:hypothetical protein